MPITELVGQLFSNSPNIAIQKNSFSIEPITWLITLASALLGGFAAALGTYYFTKRHTLEIEKREELNCLRAIHAEMSTLLDRYNSSAGRVLDEEITKNPDRTISLIPGGVAILNSSEQYFVVYDSLGRMFGRLEPDIAQKIINAYIRAKGYLDELKYMHHLLTMYGEARLKFFEDKRVNLNAYWEEALEYFNFIREHHKEIKVLIPTTISAIEKEIRRMSPQKMK